MSSQGSAGGSGGPTRTLSSGHPHELAEKARRRRARITAALLVLAALLGVVAAAFIAYARAMSRIAPTSEQAKQVAAAVDVQPAVATEPMYVLLIGDDRRPGETRARSDTLMLARVDATSKKVSLLSLPRDTRVTIQGYGIGKINAAYAYGGPALAIKTVKQFTGLPVNHYMQVDFEGLTQVVDTLGGLWVSVDRPITGTVNISPGYQRLNGAQALSFVRSRNFPEGDFVRVQHQRQFLMALAKQAMSSKQITRMPAILGQISQYLETDMSVSQILTLAGQLKGVAEKDVAGQTVPGRGAMLAGQWYLLPDETRVKQLFQQFRTGQLPEKPIDTGFQ
jgi:LCP family protein required for cell wall assembly